MDEAPQDGNVAEEDRARADCYALISRLFYAGPNAELVERLGSVSITNVDDTTSFPAALAGLRDACRSADPAALAQEHNELFAGAGRAVVTPYTSGYALPHAPDRHLLALREQLGAWGLARRDAVYEVEDHVSAVCDVMRWLIEQDHPLGVQQAFFNDFVHSGVANFCGAVEASPATSFYRAAAGLTRAFLSIEKEAFDVHMGE